MFQLHGRDVRAKWTVIELVLVLSFTIRIWAGSRVLANEVGHWELASGVMLRVSLRNWHGISMTYKSCAPVMTGRQDGPLNPSLKLIAGGAMTAY